MITDAATRPRTRLVLASASPARLALLRNAGFDVEVRVSGVDETGCPATSAAELADQLASAKAATVAEHFRAEPALVVGCDSVLDLDGHLLGKPATDEEAVVRWRQMRGRTGTLVTGHCVLDTVGGRAERAIAETAVRFGEPSDDEVRAYVATGEPRQVAGAFTIDGLGGPFVESLVGDWSNVVGLSLPTLRRLLAAHGVSVTDLWTAAAR